MSGTAESPDQAPGSESGLELDLVGATAGTILITTRVSGDSNARWSISADGTMSWGPGNTAGDITISRAGAGILDQKSGTQAQTYRIYGSASDTLTIRHTGSAGQVFTSSASHPLQLGIFGNVNWNIEASSAAWSPVVDNGTDMGSASFRARDIRWARQALMPDGTVGQPSIAMASITSTGWFKVDASTWGFSNGGAGQFEVGSGGGFAYSGGLLGFLSGALGTSADVTLNRDAAAVLALRNGVNSQTYRVYNTFTDASNYERIHIGYTSNVAEALAQQAGTGAARNLRIGTSGASVVLFQQGGADRWQIDTSGFLIGSTNNAYDIGTAANLPRSIRWGTQLLGPDGTAANPSVGFNTNVGTGLYYQANFKIGFSSNGSDFLSVGAGEVRMGSAQILGWSSNADPILAAQDASLVRDTVAVIAIKNGTAAQTFRVYGTTTGPKYINMFHDGTDGTLGLNHAANLFFATNNVNRFKIDGSTGSLLWITDNSLDIGSNAASRPRSIYWGTQALGVDGGNTAPSFSFAAQTAWGMYRASDGVYWTASSGNDQMSLHTTGTLELISTGAFAFGVTGAGSTPDVILVRDGAPAILALKNGTNGQTLRIYGTTTGPQYLRLVHDGTNSLIDVVGGGALKLQIAGTSYWLLNTSGHFIANTDNANDIGASGANRPRDIYVGTSVRIGTNPASAGAIRIQYNDGLESRNNANGADILTIAAETVNTVADIVTIGRLNSAGVIFKGRSGGAPPTTTDLAAGMCAVWRDTGGATTKLYYNNAGAIQSVALA